MNELTKLPNIGNQLAKHLYTIGIDNYRKLTAAGTERIILELLTVHKSGVCINMVYAIEGAIKGIRWHELNKERKNQLLEFYKSLDI